MEMIVIASLISLACIAIALLAVAFASLHRSQALAWQAIEELERVRLVSHSTVTPTLAARKATLRLVA